MLALAPSRKQACQVGTAVAQQPGRRPRQVTDLLTQTIVGQRQQGRYADVRATDRVGHRYVLDGQTSVRVRGRIDPRNCKHGNARRKAGEKCVRHQLILGERVSLIKSAVAHCTAL